MKLDKDLVVNGLDGGDAVAAVFDGHKQAPGGYQVEAGQIAFGATAIRP